MTETMSNVQKMALIELCAYLINKYGISIIVKHKDVTSTDCPGLNYPFDEIVNSAKMTINSSGVLPCLQSKGYDKWIAEVQKECNAQRFSKQSVDRINDSNILAGCSTIKKGARGILTKLIQERLNSVGFSLECDGIFGNQTYEAVKVFQKNRNLTSDGIVGQNTWKWLLKGTKM